MDLLTNHLLTALLEDPFHPAGYVLVRVDVSLPDAVATDGPGTVEILKAAANHKGAAVCEILQNCVILMMDTRISIYERRSFKECHLFGTR